MTTQAPAYPNALRYLIEHAGYSFREVSQETSISERTLYDWAAGNRIIPHRDREVLARLLGCPTEAFAPQHFPSDPPSASIMALHLIQYLQNYPHVYESQQAEGAGMDRLRRLLFQTIGGAGAFLVIAPQTLLNPEPWERLSRAWEAPSSIDEETLSYFEELTNQCWHWSNNNELQAVEQILPAYLPNLVTLAHQPSKYQQKAAHLATQGYILFAEIDRSNVNAMKAYCQQAILYSRIAEKSDIQVAALKQQATIFLVEKVPEKALQTYLATLPLVNQASPLLRNRIYMGLASAYARCGIQYQQDALKYLGLAEEEFPAHPERDPNYLYAICTLPVLRLYEALTYTDLEQPQDAWNALVQVDGIQPKMQVPESTRIEFTNLQAKAAAKMGNMELSCVYLQASAESSTAAGYSLWKSEAFETYQYMREIWPDESQVKTLAGLFV